MHNTIYIFIVLFSFYIIVMQIYLNIAWLCPFHMNFDSDTNITIMSEKWMNTV